MKDIKNKDYVHKSLIFGKLVLDAELNYNNLDIVTIKEHGGEKIDIKISDLEEAFDENNYSGDKYTLPVESYGVKNILKYKIHKNKNDEYIIFTGILQKNEDILSKYNILITESIALSQLQELYRLVIHAKHIASLIK